MQFAIYVHFFHFVGMSEAMINHYNYEDRTNIRFISFKWKIFVLDDEMLQISFRSDYDEFSVITRNIANDFLNGISNWNFKWIYRILNTK